MSSPRLTRGVNKIVNQPSGGGSKLQGLPPLTNNSRWANVFITKCCGRAYPSERSRNTIFCVNQLSNIGMSGGVSGRSVMFSPSADGAHCGPQYGNSGIYRPPPFPSGYWLKPGWNRGNISSVPQYGEYGIGNPRFN